MGDIENLVLCALVILLTLAPLVAYNFLEKYFFNTVKKSSKVLSDIEAINNKIKYKNIKKVYLYSYTCISRAEFNHFELDNYFIEIIGDNKSHFQNLIKAVECNKKEAIKYKKLLGKIDFTKSKEIARTVKIPFRIYQRIERICYQEKILSNMVTDIEIVCRKEYTTPTGRTHTWIDETYNYKQLLHFYEKAQIIKEQREIRRGQIEYERSLMTNSLRYEILRRDNYKCQICGSTVKDGVKLHIDHIVPVSKGGHTTPDNLRVLCDRCNLGKSDKLE